MYDEIVLYVALGIFVVFTIFFILHVMMTIKGRSKFDLNHLSKEEVKELKSFCKRLNRRKK